MLAVTLDKNTISLSAENTSSDTISIAWKCKSRCINESSFEIEFAVASVSWFFYWIVVGILSYFFSHLLFQLNAWKVKHGTEMEYIKN